MEIKDNDLKQPDETTGSLIGSCAIRELVYLSLRMDYDVYTDKYVAHPQTEGRKRVMGRERKSADNGARYKVSIW